MPGTWVKQLGRSHDCLAENTDVLSDKEASEHGIGSMWMCDCGRFWIIREDECGVHRWEWKEPMSRSYGWVDADSSDDWEWRFR